MAKPISIDDQPSITLHCLIELANETAEPAGLAKFKPGKNMAADAKPESCSKNPEIGQAPLANIADPQARADRSAFKKMSKR